MPKIWQKIKLNLGQLAFKPISPWHFQNTRLRFRVISNPSLAPTSEKISSSRGKCNFCCCDGSQRLWQSSNCDLRDWNVKDHKKNLVVGERKRRVKSCVEFLAGVGNQQSISFSRHGTVWCQAHPVKNFIHGQGCFKFGAKMFYIRG